MIYHTAAEINYYNAFFKRWHKSIVSIHPDAKFSLKFVGEPGYADVVEYAKANNISLILDPTTHEDLIKKYGSMNNGSGYYPMARWNSIPDNDDVCVTDVDVVMLTNHLDEIIEQLKTYDIVSISRLKSADKVNLMMINYIKKNACAEIKNIALKLMDHKDFRWDIDLAVMSKAKKAFNLTYTHKLAKFDRQANLEPNPEFNAYFGYYSAIPIVLDDISYAGGLDAKKAKYEWADKNNVFNFSSNQSASQD